MIFLTTGQGQQNGIKWILSLFNENVSSDIVQWPPRKSQQKYDKVTFVVFPSKPEFRKSLLPVERRQSTFVLGKRMAASTCIVVASTNT